MADGQQKHKIAIVCEWLTNISGSERVAKALHEIYPAAPIYTLVYDKKFTDSFLPGAKIYPSFLQKFFKLLPSRQLLTPFFPIAIESFDLSEFDIVLSSSFSFAKGLVLRPKTIHISYCFSPMRQLWDWQAEYKKEKKRTPAWVVALFQHFLRIWDRQTSSRVDHFIAISEVVKRRLEKYYKVNAKVIYPPVERAPESDKLIGERGFVKFKNYFLIVSRLFANKNIDIAVKAFGLLGWRLVIIGDGPELSRLKKIAKENVIFLGYQPDEVVAKYYQNCFGFIMPQEEDFGITPIEALIHGKPVLALRRGGALEYVREGINGEFFDDPIPEVLADGVRRLRDNLKNYNFSEIKKSAEPFFKERFKIEIVKFVEDAISQSRNSYSAV